MAQFGVRQLGAVLVTRFFIIITQLLICHQICRISTNFTFTSLSGKYCFRWKKYKAFFFCLTTSNNRTCGELGIRISSVSYQKRRKPAFTSKSQTMEPLKLLQIILVVLTNFFTKAVLSNLVSRAFPLKAGKDPGIGWSRVHLTP